MPMLMKKSSWRVLVLLATAGCGATETQEKQCVREVWREPSARSCTNHVFCSGSSRKVVTFSYFNEDGRHWKMPLTHSPGARSFSLAAPAIIEQWEVSEGMLSLGNTRAAFECSEEKLAVGESPYRVSYLRPPAELQTKLVEALQQDGTWSAKRY